MTPDLREKVENAARAILSADRGFEIDNTYALDLQYSRELRLIRSGAEFMHTLMAERIESLEAALKQISQANYDDIEGVFTLAREALENK